MDLLVLDTAIPYKPMSTLKKHITDFGTFPQFILTCIQICFSLLLQYYPFTIVIWHNKSILGYN
jgi:hypothetical protein